MEMTAMRALMLRGGGGGGGGSGMELVKSWTYDKKIVQDGVIEAMPSYSTSNESLVDAATIETLTLNTGDYYYYIFDRFLTIPIYDTTVLSTGMEEYHFVVKNGWIYPGTTYKAISDPTKTTGSIASSTSYLNTVLVYWGPSALESTTTSGYGAYQSVSSSITFTASTREFSVKSPSLRIRGNTTYFTQTAWSHLTDVRYQYVLDLYRTPKTGDFRNYWGQFDHVLDCVNSADHKLT